MKIALGLEYDGSRYFGWQYQKDCISVQQVVQDAASKVANHEVNLLCAGRTDSGVHATGQVVHFESDANRNQRNWILGINANLPHDVSVQWVQEVDDTFHARFEAVSRSYRYIILNTFARSALLHKRVTQERRALDEKKMHEAAQYLVGEHDFTSYRAVHCQAKSPIKTMHKIEVSRHGEFVFIDIHGNAFLHHMVRNIAGVLMDIGAGEQAIDWSKQVLDAQDRKNGGVTAPAAGLYLVHVEYPQHYGIQNPIKCPIYGYQS